jgi:hypothetical protein
LLSILAERRFGRGSVRFLTLPLRIDGALMPRGPQGQKRPAGTVECAVMVAKIATGEVVEEADHRSVGKIRSGKAGAKARAKSLNAEERSAIARKAATSRWHS